MQIQPEVKTLDARIPCKLCGNTQDIWEIHYPFFVFRSGDFEAPPWVAHTKNYCPRCHFLWTNMFDALSLAEYGAKYVENNYDHQRRPTEARMAFAPLLLSFLIRRSGGQRFLDYGCGYNYSYLYELRSRGFDLWGCDISSAVPYSRYVRCLPSERYPNNFFDGLYSIDVLEHLADFENDVRNMTGMMRPGGYMLHNTISLDNYWIGEGRPPTDPMVWAPWHCSIFSERSAKFLSKRIGLEFCGVVRTRSDTGLAFLFRKPGSLPLNRFNYFSIVMRLLKLLKYRYYFRKSYTTAS